MSGQPPATPTERELEILQVLWDSGPSTVAQVHAQLTEVRRVGYTSVLKMLQLMAGKGLVLRDTSRHAHVYRSALDRDQVESQLTEDFLDRVFRGSAVSLVSRLFGSSRLSDQELDEVRRLLNEETGDG